MLSLGLRATSWLVHEFGKFWYTKFLKILHDQGDWWVSSKLLRRSTLKLSLILQFSLNWDFLSNKFYLFFQLFNLDYSIYYNSNKIYTWKSIQLQLKLYLTYNLPTINDPDNVFTPNRWWLEFNIAINTTNFTNC